MRLIRNLVFYCLSIAIATKCQAQKITEFQKDYQLDLIKTTDVIKIDGILDEAIWANTKLVNVDNKIGGTCKPLNSTGLENTGGASKLS